MVGFPLGANTSETKVFEAKNAIENGADEIDMVINIGALKSGMIEEVQADIQKVVEVVKDQALVKVVIETSLLTQEELITACEMARAAGADLVKTSTDFFLADVNVEDVQQIKEIVDPVMGIQAAGNIHTEDEALAMAEAGATRLATSASVSIINGDTKV